MYPVIKKMPLWLKNSLTINNVIYLCIIGVMIWSIMQPYMITVYNQFDNVANLLQIGSIEFYVNKYCMSQTVNKKYENKCGDDNVDFGNISVKDWLAVRQSIYALYILVIILSGIYIFLCILNKTLYCKISGIALLLIAIALLIMLISVVVMDNIKIGFYYNNFDFTAGSITTMVICCLIIVHQLYSNQFLNGWLKLIKH